MIENTSYDLLTEKDKEKFTKIVQHFLYRPFLLKEREEDKLLYRFCELHYDLIATHLEISGIKLHHAKYQYMYYVEHASARNRYNLTLNESLFLFILRLLYEEALNVASISKEIIVSNKQVLEKYNALQIKKRQPSQDEHTRILRLFERYALIEHKEGSIANEDGLFVVYPSIAVVINPEKLSYINQWLEEKGEEQDEVSEEI
ncbi:DUF4194 domain-containing protein (plasmid) [Rossellomorea sp. AcN35-11]|nr:DUF4194 domain-containing protein [Rossellomorea aquimaris]WJV32052.1 DUF4194 domain-containing protein [Rossellomorea sp. AcN35-11]